MLFVWLLLLVAKLSEGTFDPELHAKYLQLPYDEFIQYFNEQNYSWKISQYPHLDHRYLYGAKLHNVQIDGAQIIHHDPKTIAHLPKQFDARDKWPNCETIQEIYDQGGCGSCWTFGTATVASDRTCIHKGLNVRLAEQDFNCFEKNICQGGEPYDAFLYWTTDGLVTQECQPYNITESALGICKTQCKDPSINYVNDKHYGDKVYALSSNDGTIMAELFTNGPIEASFEAYADFRNYSSGIYEHKYGEHLDGHSVRVIGYGEEQGVEYWLVANSWGKWWGEKGLVKIKRHQPLLEFEAHMIAGLPK